MLTKPNRQSYKTKNRKGSMAEPIWTAQVRDKGGLRSSYPWEARKFPRRALPDQEGQGDGS